MKMLIECVVQQNELPQHVVKNKQISNRASLSWQEIIIPWCILPKESCPVVALA
jgi:hypothetical protein